MYKLTQNGVRRLTDNAIIPNDPLNKDWQEYQIWLSLGNVPEPEYTVEEKASKDWYDYKTAAQSQLIKTDVKWKKIGEACALGINNWSSPDVVNYIMYVRNLRSIVHTIERPDPVPVELPPEPDVVVT